MPTYPHRPSVNIPHTPESWPLDGELVRPAYPSAPRGDVTDGMMLMGAARAHMLRVRLSADTARDVLDLGYELRCRQQDRIESFSTRAMTRMRENPDNPLMLDGVQSNYYQWLDESNARIRHEMERGW